MVYGPERENTRGAAPRSMTMKELRELKIYASTMKAVLYSPHATESTFRPTKDDTSVSSHDLRSAFDSPSAVPLP